MEKSWLGKMFSPAQKKKASMVPPNVDYSDAAVQFSLGLQCASSAGAAQDYAQAADWYRKAAEQNHGLAQFNLGTMYANGQGVAQDDTQSLVWFGRAANLGDAGGQYKMGRSCQRASMDGAPAEAPEARIEAYKWYQLSAAQGYKNSEGAYATLTFKMTREDVTEAIQRVANFSVVKAFKPASA
jgi:TPR repeat protein